MMDRSYLFVPGNRPERFDKAADAAANNAVRLDGKLIDRPIIDRARAILAIVERPRS
jgi:citrate lyase beta subunit